MRWRRLEDTFAPDEKGGTRSALNALGDGPTSE